LRLAERAALWNARPESRHLPSAVEWANIRLLTEKQKWTGLERRMMKQAGRLHGLRALGVAAGLLVLVLAGLDIRRRVVEANEQTIAGESVKSLVRVKIAQVPDIVKSMAKYRRWVDPALREVVARSSEGSPERLHASIALLPVDEGQVEYLYNRLLAADADDVSVLRESLKPHQASLIPKLWTVLDSSRPGDAGLLPAASSLAIYDPGNARWAQAGAKVAEAIVQVNAIDLRPWLEALRPVRGKLTASLAAVFREKPRSPIEHSQATNILTDYAGDEPGLIAGLLMDSDNKAYASFFPIAAGHAARTLQLFEEELAKKPAFSGSDSPPVISEEAKDQLAERQARAAVALVRMGKIDEVLPKLAHSPDPRLRSFILNWLKSLGADPRIIAAELHRLDAPATRHSPLVGRGSPDPARSADRRSPSSGATPDSGRPSVTERAGSGDPRPTLSGDPRPTGSGDLAAANPDSPATRHSPPATQRMDAILFHPETSIRRALILALGTYGPDAFSPSEREPLIRNLLKLYTDDPDSGIHGAAEWTLRQFNEQAKLKSAAADLTKLKDRGDRRWLVNSQGQAFVLIEGPVEFTMGSPPTEPDRNSIEALHRRLIPRRFAIATKEVTVEEYQAFMRENPGSHGLSIDKYSPDPKGPMNGPSWFDAAAYCNWLSKKEGLAEDQWCYVRNAKGEYDSEMTIPADILKRKGYRLPTEAEWEYACRAGAVTSRCYGLSLDLLAKYARYSGNSAERAWPGGSLLPNDLGLFDMLGNVYEWCNERYYDYQAVGDRVSVDNINTSEHVDINPRILRGGSFFSHAALVRSALRFWNAPANRYSDLGFRPSRTYD